MSHRIVPAQFVSSERIYVDADGKAVGHDDPSKVSLLVAEGASIPLADAQKAGIADSEGNPIDWRGKGSGEAADAEGQNAPAEPADEDADADAGDSDDKEKAVKAPAKTKAVGPDKNK